MPSIQPSQLLASLFRQTGDDERLSVFDVGTVVPETMEYFSSQRSKLYFANLFSELPILTDVEEGPSLAQQFDELLPLPGDARFDVCLFWDIFNYMDRTAISAFLARLRPHLHANSRGHGFAMHNLKGSRHNHRYGVSAGKAISIRERGKPLPGYAPHNQGELKSLLHCFTVERTVLLSDSRLEMVLRAKL